MVLTEEQKENRIKMVLTPKNYESTSSSTTSSTKKDMDMIQMKQKGKNENVASPTSTFKKNKQMQMKNQHRNHQHQHRNQHQHHQHQNNNQDGTHLKRVYDFTEGSASDKWLLGAKGANLCEMTKMGLPVPPGFIISTHTCREFFTQNQKNNKSSSNNNNNKSNHLPHGLEDEYLNVLKRIEQQTGKEFGNPQNPLLFSVRSGAAVSMPGMMDTVLNLGMNDEIAHVQYQKTKNLRWVYDTYRRFIQMFANVVLGFSSADFERVIADRKRERGVTLDVELSGEDWRLICHDFQSIVGDLIPKNPFEQLRMAIEAVFSSWFTPRAKKYRLYNEINDDIGTGVNVQMMVFGNINDNSGTGVAFTRNPATGENKFFGEYLVNAAGEDVVSGVRTPSDLDFLKTIRRQQEEEEEVSDEEDETPEQPVSDVRRKKKNHQKKIHLDAISLQELSLEDTAGLPNLPVQESLYGQLWECQRTLETHFRDMQDIEFTVQDGTLFMLQTRTGKRTAKGAVKMAIDMVKEGSITMEEALLRIDTSRLDFFLHDSIDPKAQKTILAKGLPASPGAATGKIIFCPEEAERLVAEAKRSKKEISLILVRKETTADDIHGMKACNGILTIAGGMTSHAAVVARGMGKCCISGCGSLQFDAKSQSLIFPDGRVMKKFDIITLDGIKGEVLLGNVDRVGAGADEDFKTILEWADKFRNLKVLANADTPEDTANALKLGAEGIGLCRTEHMFFKPNRVLEMRKMILADDKEERQAALNVLQSFQKEDMKQILKIMHNKPVTIRLLDPPLHEFLPSGAKDIQTLADTLGVDFTVVNHRVNELHEVNPMLGFRGCRLSVQFPEITEMQIRAIILASIELYKETGVYSKPVEIMIPLVSTKRELDFIMPNVESVVQEVFSEQNAEVPYVIGTMMEVPRACLRADSFAKEVGFMSFGTNDLTQMTFGFSRDDIGVFLPSYIENKVLNNDPFSTLDQRGVGSFIKIAVDLAKQTNPDLKMGVCGEHGGDPRSIKFFNKVGLNYVSCSPFRVPIARVAAAQAAIEEKLRSTTGKN